MRTLNRRTGMIGAVVVTAAAAGSMVAPATVGAEPQGYLQVDFGVGYTYGTFDQAPNMAVLVGGKAEDFCLEDPEDPFNAEPGIAQARIFFRKDGQVDVKVNDKDQPIHLYYQPDKIGPEWINAVCADIADGDPAPEPFASGTADLKVRISVISDGLVDVFNSVNGKATAEDGTEYKVRGSADLVVVNGVPDGDPADFVSLTVTEIKR